MKKQEMTPREADDNAPAFKKKAEVDDPRAVEILTTEHWSLLSTRTLGYQEMFARTTIFTAVLSAILVALAFLAQATHFGRETLLVALLLLSVALFIGLTTFARSIMINYEDARWRHGMNLLRHAYLQMVPGLERYFVTGHDPDADPESLTYGRAQHPADLVYSLTTTSSVVAALNSVLAGAIASDIAALLGAKISLAAIIGAVVSLVSAVVHVRLAARYREKQRT